MPNQIKVGDEFNPNSLFDGVWIPNCLMERAEITGLEKMLLGVLLKNINDDGTHWKQNFCDFAETLG